MQIKSLPISAGALAYFLPAAMAACSPCAPGGTFDLSKWKLQLPVGSTGKPDEVLPAGLVGCNGYQSDLFCTDPADGALVMKVQGGPPKCVTTPNSDHCRTELREQIPLSWNPNTSVNRLFGDLIVNKITNDRVVIGQVKIDGTISTKPVCEIYYHTNGDLNMGINRCRTCGQDTVKIGHVPRGQRFTYEIRYEGCKLSVSINGQAFQKLPTFNLNCPLSYFKAGNYNQGNAATEVRFFDIKISH